MSLNFANKDLLDTKGNEKADFVDTSAIDLPPVKLDVPYTYLSTNIFFVKPLLKDWQAC